MKPKLKPDVYWVPNAEGVVFIHPSRYLHVKGRTVLPLMDRLAPHLDGSVSLEELVSELPQEKKDMVTTLVTALHEASLVKDAQDDRAHDLGEEELAAYAAEIAYIDYFADSAGWRFQRYRETPVVCVGAGLSLAALVHACLRSGVRTVTALVGEECPTDVERLDEYAERLCDARQTFARRALDDLSAVVEAGQAVLHVSDLPMAGRAAELAEVCRRSGRVLVQGVMEGDTAWTGPVSAPEGWESFWSRRRANQAPGAGEAVSDYLAGPTASIVANRVSFLLFRHLTGIAEVTGQRTDSVSRVDLETLQTSEHRFHPHPAAEPAEEDTEAAFAERYAGFLGATELDDQRFSEVVAGCFDPEAGLLGRLAEEEITQLPLFACTVTVSDPFTLLDLAGGPVTVGGGGPDLRTARHRGATTALLAYAALAVDRRRLSGSRVYAHNLTLDKPELIEARTAFPALDAAGSPAVSFRPPVGLAAGRDADAALTAALLDHCVTITAAAAPQAAEPFPRLDDLPLDELGGRYRELLRAARLPVEVYDVTGALGVPTYALCAGARTVAYVAASALTEGLERVLLDHQGALTSRVVPQLPQPLRGTAGTPRPATPLTWQDLLEALSAQGYQVHALPAGHDPVLTGVLPTVVQAVVHV